MCVQRERGESKCCKMLTIDESRKRVYELSLYYSFNFPVDLKLFTDTELQNSRCGLFLVLEIFQVINEEGMTELEHLHCVISNILVDLSA